MKNALNFLHSEISFNVHFEILEIWEICRASIPDELKKKNIIPVLSMLAQPRVRDYFLCTTYSLIYTILHLGKEEMKNRQQLLICVLPGLQWTHLQVTKVILSTVITTLRA